MTGRAGTAKVAVITVLVTMSIAAMSLASLPASAATISQIAPFGNSVDVASSAAFTDNLVTSGAVGSVTFTTTNPISGLNVSSSGAVSTTRTLSVAGSPYTVSGTDTDGSGDTGNWTYSLTVTPDTITQGPPGSGFTNSDNSGTFTSMLSAASGSVGTVTFATSTPGFTIANGDELETTGSLTSANSPYAVTGTDSDAYGDTGSWTYSLAVAAVGVKTTLIQTSATTGSVQNTSSSSFTAGPITVEDNTGSVTFVTTSTNPGLTVSASGVISTSGPLATGTYKVSGNDSDVHGDTGTWTYTLTVTGVVVTVTFEANGGGGSMTPQNESEPTALSLNSFTWPGHTFVDWNTLANGSGVSYANGSVFPFNESTKLFAQWKSGKAPSRTITFNANGGKGSTSSEVDNTPTAISANHFTRAGFTFVDWATSANGSGERFKGGSTYSFKKSITLYAQWKKLASPSKFTVTFVANGGTGTMSAEDHGGAGILTPNHFTRVGYIFSGWNTVPNGSGVSYANRASYAFSSSATLYAQWKRDKTVAPTPIEKTAMTIGPFGLGSSALSPNLDSLVDNLAEIAKADGSKQIALLGYGDADSSTSAQLGQKRAQAVAIYLEKSLSALGLKGWTISLASAQGTTSGGKSAAGYVIVSLS